MKDKKPATKQDYKNGFRLYVILGLIILAVGLLLYLLNNEVLADTALFWAVGAICFVFATWQLLEYRLFDIEKKLGLHEEAKE